MSEAPDEEQAEEQPTPPKEKKRRTLAMGSIVVLATSAIAGAGAGVAVVGPRLASGSEAESEQGEVEREVSPEDLVVYTLDDLIANPAGSNGSRFVMFSVGIEVEGEEESVEEEIGRYDAQLRDRLLGLIGEKTAAELAEVGARQALKEEIHAVVSEVLAETTVYDIYLPEYVIN